MAAVGQRGQLVLVAALVIAAALVGLSVVVNTAIYTENLATERSSVGDETLQRQHEARQIVGGAIEAANRNNSSDRSTLDSGLETAVNESMEFVQSRDAESGLVTEVTVVSVNEYAWRVSQNDSDRPLTSAQGNAEWTVVPDVTPADGRGTRAFELNLTEIPETASQPLVVNTTEYNGSGVNVSAPNEWRMEIEGNVDNSSRPVVVTVESVTGDTEQCSKAGVEKGYVRVDVTEGTIADKPCDALRTYPLATDVTDVSDSYNISFERGDEARGTYSLVARNTSSLASVNTGSLSELNHASGDSPRVRDAIYEVSADVEIHSSDLSYEARLRVEAGEFDD
jgi:hypothetical protein